MTNDQPSVTTNMILETLLAFRTEMNVFQKVTQQEFKGVHNKLEHHDALLAGIHDQLEHHDSLFAGIHDQLENHDDLLETIARDVSLVHDQLDEHEKRFTNIDNQLVKVENRFTTIDHTLKEIKETLRHHDDLIETVAREVNTLVTSSEPLVPVQYDHEERISRLERGYTRILLKS